LGKKYAPQGNTETVVDAGAGARSIRLTLIASGFEQPTGMAFVPDEPQTALVLEKTGRLRWLDTTTGKSGVLTTLPVTTRSEQGLLGIAFHPRFAENRRFFLHSTVNHEGTDKSRVEAWKAGPGSLRSGTVEFVSVVLELKQPYANHNGGHLAFGPDGHLYIGFGDGGSRADPLGAGQDLTTWLGKMLRIDVDHPEAGHGYAVPPDNPFVGRADAKPEIWALGLRNPWRYAFSPDGRLVVADVGQDAWEEVGFVAKGDNAGWSVWEGRHCFRPATGCASSGFRAPFVEYGRDQGQSVTGGVVVTSRRLKALEGQYVFGDFVTGRLWAVALPPTESTAPVEPILLGKWQILPVSFTTDVRGDAYVVDFSGNVFRLDD
jgi:glucose/arabinose dehydrogenase